MSNNKTSVINNIGGGLAYISLLTSHCSETRHECVKKSVENVPFGALALCVLCHKVSSPFLVMCKSVLPFAFSFVMAAECFFMVTILQLKVAKRRLVEEVSLEHCKVLVAAVFA